MSGKRSNAWPSVSTADPSSRGGKGQQVLAASERGSGPGRPLRGIRDDRSLSACHDDRTMTSGHGLLDRAPSTHTRLLFVGGGLGGRYALGARSRGGVDEVSIR